MGSELLHQLLLRSAERAPDALALRDEHGELGYADLLGEACRLARWLLYSGLERGDRIAILMERRRAQAVAILASSIAGGAFVVLSPQHKRRQLAHVLSDSGARFLFVQPSFRERVETFAGTQLLLDGIAPPCRPTAVDEAGAPRWCAIRTSFEPALPPSTDLLTGNDLGTIIYTSGSTGLAKGVVIPQRNLCRGAEIVSGYLALGPRDRLLSVLPFAFDYGLNQLTSAMHVGASLVLHDYFLPRDLVRLLRTESITGFAGLRPIWLAMFKGRFAVEDSPGFPALRYITNTGGTIPPPVLEAMRRYFADAEIFLMYGLTEAFRSTYLPPAELSRRPTSIGKAVEGVEVLVLDDEQREVAPGQEGELVHAGDLVARGYYNDEEATARVFRPDPRPGHEGTVVYSGDLVQRDEAGFLYFVSRRDALIKAAGHRISPTEIEEAALRCCGATQAVAFAREPDDGGDVEIVLVLEVDQEPVDTRTLRNALREELPSYMLPTTFRTEARLPRTATGKIDRAALRELT